MPGIWIWILFPFNFEGPCKERGGSFSFFFFHLLPSFGYSRAVNHHAVMDWNKPASLWETLIDSTSLYFPPCSDHCGTKWFLRLRDKKKVLWKQVLLILLQEILSPRTEEAVTELLFTSLWKSRCIKLKRMGLDHKSVLQGNYRFKLFEDIYFFEVLNLCLFISPCWFQARR